MVEGMDSPKRRPVAILLARGLELVDESDVRIAPRRTVRRAEIPWLERLRTACAAGVPPLFASKLGLEVPRGNAPSLTETELVENGAMVLAKVRTAVSRRDLGNLRKLAAWFTFPTLYMPKVQQILDGLPRYRAEQIAGRVRGSGRPAEPDRQLRLLATMELLSAQEGISSARAAERIRKVSGVGARGLQNLKSMMGKLAGCLRGYRIPASETLCTRWGEKPDDEFAMYIVESKSDAGPDQAD
jgi:hypothetical protein